MTVFRGTGSGFAPNTSVNVTVTVDTGNGAAAYTGGYTHTHWTDASGGFSWAWIWTAGDPYGSYTLTFDDGGKASVGIGLTIENGASPPAATDGSDLMVDTGTAPTSATMQAWQQSSPYDAIGVYVPVDPRVDDRHDKVQANLNKPWVLGVQAGGWHVVPIYVGLQAPATCQRGAFHAMNSDPSKAEAEGVAAAKYAVFAANELGIDAAMPVVYDMEAYTRGSCSTAVRAFLVGWTAELHALGRPAGVYGAPRSAGTDLVAAAASDPTYMLPDLFWAATDNRKVSPTGADLPASTWVLGNQFLLGVPRSYSAGSDTVVDESAVDKATWTLASRLRPPDTTAPIVAMGNAPDLIRTGTTSFAWSGVDAGSGIAGYQLRTRHTADGHAAGVWSAPTSMPASTRASTAVKVRPGEQVCAQVRAVDAVGNASDWTFADCASRLDDDRSAKPGAGWHRGHARAAYQRTVTIGKRSHAVLNLGRTAGGRLAVAMSGHGPLLVKVAGKRVGIIRGTGTHWVALPRKGKVTFTTVNRRKVSVDGFVMTPR